MPRVPQYETTQVTQEVAQQPRLGAEAFGGSQAQQLGQVGKAVADTGESLINYQENVAKIKSRESVNYLLPQIDQDFNELQVKNQGSMATLDKIGEFNKAVDQRIAEQTKGLSRYEADMVAADINSKRTQYAMRWNDYSTKQLETAKVNSLSVENDRLARLKADGIQDDSGIPVDLQIRQNLKNVYKGQDEAVISAEMDKLVGKATFDKAQVMAEQDPKAALEYVNANETYINAFNPVASARLKSGLEVSAQKQDIETEAQTILGTTSNINDALTKAAESKNPDATTERVMQLYDRQKKIDERLIGSYANSQLKSLIANPDAYNTPRNLVLPPAMANAFDAYKDIAINNDDGDEALFKEALAKIANDAEWQTTDVAAYANGLSSKQYGDLLKLYVGRYEGRDVPNKTEVLDNEKIIKTTVKTLDARFLKDSAAVSQNEKLQLDNIEIEYRKRVQERISRLESVEGKRLGKAYTATIDDVQKIARSVALNMDDVKEKVPGIYSINDRNLRTLGIAGSVGEYKSALRKELKEKGVKDADDKFLETYFNYKLNSSIYR